MSPENGDCRTCMRRGLSWPADFVGKKGKPIKWCIKCQERRQFQSMRSAEPSAQQDTEPAKSA